MSIIIHKICNFLKTLTLWSRLLLHPPLLDAFVVNGLYYSHIRVSRDWYLAVGMFSFCAHMNQFLWYNFYISIIYLSMIYQIFLHNYNLDINTLSIINLSVNLHFYQSIHHLSILAASLWIIIIIYSLMSFNTFTYYLITISLVILKFVLFS